MKRSPFYESHLTVVDTDFPTFQAWCQLAGVKPLHIQRDSGSGVDQIMTAHFHPVGSSLEAVIAQVHQWGKSCPGKPLRHKVEQILPRGELPPEGSYLYQEAHLKWRVQAGLREHFEQEFHRLGAHTSHNATKPAPPGSEYLFATVRKTGLIWHLWRMFERDPRIQYVNLIREVVVYDDYPDLDRNWVCDCPLKTDPTPPLPPT